jgi:hypothetical protein
MSDGKAFTPFEPSANQLAVLSAFQAAEYGCKVAAACEAGGVSARSYYFWHDDPAFSAWWRDQSNRHFSLQLGRVHAATLKSATVEDAPGDPRAQKLFYERFDRDYCPGTRNQISGPGGGAIPIQIVMFGTPPGSAVDDTNETEPGDSAAGA